MIYELFEPEERGMALGIWGVAAMAAPAIGPVLGGFLVTVVGWRGPLPDQRADRHRRRAGRACALLRDLGDRDERPLDAAGLVVAAAGLVLVLLALSEAPTWGWGVAGVPASSPSAALVLLVAWVAARAAHRCTRSSSCGCSPSPRSASPW